MQDLKESSVAVSSRNSQEVVIKDKLNCMFVNARSLLTDFKVDELIAYADEK